MEPAVPAPDIGSHHLLRHDAADVSVQKVQSCFDGADVKEIAKMIARSGQRELQAKFNAVYNTTTRSNNNDWLRRKLYEAIGMKTSKKVKSSSKRDSRKGVSKTKARRQPAMSASPSGASLKQLSQTTLCMPFSAAKRTMSSDDMVATHLSLPEARTAPRSGPEVSPESVCLASPHAFRSGSMTSTSTVSASPSFGRDAAPLGLRKQHSGSFNDMSRMQHMFKQASDPVPTVCRQTSSVFEVPGGFPKRSALQHRDSAPAPPQQQQRPQAHQMSLLPQQQHQRQQAQLRVPQTPPPQQAQQGLWAYRTQVREQQYQPSPLEAEDDDNDKLLTLLEHSVSRSSRDSLDAFLEDDDSFDKLLPQVEAGPAVVPRGRDALLDLLALEDGHDADPQLAGVLTSVSGTAYDDVVSSLTHSMSRVGSCMMGWHHQVQQDHVRRTWS